MVRFMLNCFVLSLLFMVAIKCVKRLGCQNFALYLHQTFGLPQKKSLRSSFLSNVRRQYWKNVVKIIILSKKALKQKIFLLHINFQKTKKTVFYL